MSWILLINAGIFEIGWAIALKQTEGFTRICANHCDHHFDGGEPGIIRPGIKTHPFRHRRMLCGRR